MNPTGSVNDGGEEDGASLQTKVNEWKQLRSSTKGNITRIKTFIAKKGSTLSKEELECRLGILESYFKQCMSVQANIDKVCREEDVGANAAAVAEIEEVYVSSKTKIMSLMSKGRTSVADLSVLNGTTSVAAPRVRRKIKLPKFEGKYSEFPKFITIFNKLIHQDESLDDCERFLILKEHLGARPLAAIADFDVTDDNYPKAKERLNECFDKKALMFEEHIAALFALPKSVKSSASELRNIVDSVNAHLSAMLSLGSYKDIANAMAIHLVMERVDLESQIKWEESVDYSQISQWEECSAVLTKRCQNLEARESKSGFMSSKPTHSHNNGKQRRHDQTSLAVAKISCAICNGGNHDIPSCKEFLKMTLRNRYSAVRRAKVCFVSLKYGHMQRMCTASKCSECNLPHHKLLHKQPSPDQNGSDSTIRHVDVSNESASTSTARSSVMSMTAETEVFLATAIVMVMDSSGRYHQARAILDSASQINIMCESLAQKLNLKRYTCHVDASGVGETATKLKKRTTATVKSRLNELEFNLDFYLLPKITSLKPEKYFDTKSWNIPKNIQLADPAFNKPSKVDILLGAEMFLDLLAIGRIELQDKLPKLQKTTLGWIVSGKANRSVVSSLFVNTNDCEDVNLANQVERFWEMEQLRTKNKFYTEEEEECEQIFLNTTQRDSCGRFIVKIPFQPTVNNLGESYSAANRRLMSLERRLARDPSLRESYNAFMEEYLALLGHMAEVDEADIKDVKYFSPHQHVLRPESTSTKLRVVFDCSCKTNSGLSLNDVMRKGPVVQDDLLSIILRFRCYRYAITADVTKMYRQMWVTEDDANYQAILWRFSPEEKLKVYRLRTITYGTTSGPYLATRCLKKLAEDYAVDYAVGSKKILTDFYMDDLISGSSTEDELFEIYHQVNAVMNTAKLTLRKWYSNSKRFLDVLSPVEKEKPIRLNDTEIIKTLGIIWDPVKDAFRYVWPKFDINKAVTMRIVLSELAMLFDPLGLINPIVVKGKILMQDLWILKLNWDESLPMDVYSQWTEYRERLKGVEEMSISRYILSENKCVRVEMHGFADASKRAYGCCIYIRSITADDDVSIRLWSAKSKVAPLKTQSLPRLELMAAGLLSKLMAKTRSNFPIDVDGTYLWTDSEIVLDWLSEHPSIWNTFVANRVSLIQEESKKAVWRHVPSKSNPADIISRGAYANELTNSIWFSGPEFLKKQCSEWPANKSRQKSSDANQERVRSTITLIVNSDKSSLVQWIEKHGDFEKLQRRVALLLSVCRKGETGVRSITNDEILVRIIFCIQQYYFQEEIATISKNRELSTNNKYRSLSLFIEDKYDVPLLRVGGRLANAGLPYDSKHQILLPGSSEFVRCYVRHLHLKYLHAGAQALMAILRQRFWVPQARKVIRSVVASCLQCFRCRPKLCNQIMGDLPPARVSVAKPFTVTGVDFCGPITTTFKLRGTRTTKSYVAVFICFSTKAVHLEVVSDLTAKAFIATLKRFVARRGLCTQLFCDNATNFVGARHELDHMRKIFFDQQVQGKISTYCEVNNIEFRHIPPRSPHFGGLWEAAVKSAKYHLARVFGDAYLTFEELATVVAEVEAILNSRPLITLSNDPNDEGVLTPAHFLTGGPLVGVAEPTFDSENWSLRDRWLRICAIQQHFWKRWSMEYLHELQQKVKWTKQQKNLHSGDLVLVGEDNLPPKQWLIGRVVNVIHDSKGCARVADVKTKNGQIRRAIHKLAPIPKPNDD